MRRRKVDALDQPRLLGVRVSLVRRIRVAWEGREEDLLMLDLGLRGVYLEHASAPAPGTPATVRFALPGNDRPIAASCRVAWRHQGHSPESAMAPPGRPPGCGLEFLEIDEADTRRITRHLAAHMAKPGHARLFVRAWPDPDDDRAHAREGEEPIS